jgi:hypothetical protein
MSHNLAGRQLNDVLVEFYGPLNGRSYHPVTPAALPQFTGQLFGADPATRVVLEQCTTMVIQGSNNSSAIGSTPVRGAKLVFSQNPTDWVVAGTYSVVAGKVVTVATIGTTIVPVGVRLRISVVPAGSDPLTGSVALISQWV